MDIALWIAALAAVVVGIAGMVLPMLPGTPLLFGGLWLAAWLDGYARVSVTTVVILAVLALLAFAADYVAAALGVKKAGASRQAMIGAGIGALVGIAGGLVGLIVGPVIGAMIGEWIARKDRQQAAKAGLAAGLGFVAAVAVKIGIAFAMLGVFAFAYFV